LSNFAGVTAYFGEVRGLATRSSPTSESNTALETTQITGQLFGRERVESWTLLRRMIVRWRRQSLRSVERPPYTPMPGWKTTNP